MSENTRKIAFDYIKYGDSLYLETLVAFISYELTKLQKDKARVLQNEEPTGINGYILRLYAPFKPIILIWFSIIILIASYAIYSIQHTWYDRLNIIILFLSIFLSLAVLLAMLSMLFDNQFRPQGRYRWVLLISIFSAPFITVISVSLSIFSLIVQIIGFYETIKLNNKKPSIITLD